MKNLYAVAPLIAGKTIESQGCSLNLDGYVPVKGYMIGIKGKELKVNILDFNTGQIDHFIRANLDFLHKRNYFVGTWINGDQVYIDLSLNL
jgi:hypothetical protein